MAKNQHILLSQHGFVEQAVQLIQAARQQAVRQTNSLMVFTYFQLGKLIVEEEQNGQAKATYGEEIICNLSKVLTRCFGKGFSERNLQQIRLFFLFYQGRLASKPIPQTVSAESPGKQKSQTLSAKFNLPTPTKSEIQSSFAE